VPRIAPVLGEPLCGSSFRPAEGELCGDIVRGCFGRALAVPRLVDRIKSPPEHLRTGGPKGGQIRLIALCAAVAARWAFVQRANARSTLVTDRRNRVNAIAALL
jgi:hypothetical protein